MAYLPTPVEITDVLKDKTTVKTETVTGNLFFTKSLYGGFKAVSGTENFLFSPLTLEVLLSLAYVGAAGGTSNELKAALEIPDEKDLFLETIDSILKVCKADKETFRSVNGMFINEEYSPTKEFAEAAKEQFETEVKPVDFKEGKKTHDAINKFVKEKTSHKIPEIVAKDSELDPESVMILVNAFHFKGNWAQKFEKVKTGKGDFHFTAEDKVLITFMSHEGLFKMAQNQKLNATVVNIPYEGNEISLVLVIPNETEGLGLIEETLPDLDLHEMAIKVNEEPMRLILPRFTLDETVNLKPVLEHIGVKGMLSQKDADFTFITGNQKLSCTDVVQKCHLEVREEEKEEDMDSASVMTLRPKSGPTVVRANKPFLFYFWHNELNRVVIMGRVTYLS